MKKVFFDEASGIMQDGISTSNMKIIQRGTAENSLIKINVYHGANDGGAYLFQISTWQKKPVLNLRPAIVNTGTRKRTK